MHYLQESGDRNGYWRAFGNAGPLFGDVTALPALGKLSSGEISSSGDDLALKVCCCLRKQVLHTRSSWHCIMLMYVFSAAAGKETVYYYETEGAVDGGGAHEVP